MVKHVRGNAAVEPQVINRSESCTLPAHLAPGAMCHMLLLGGGRGVCHNTFYVACAVLLAHVRLAVQVEYPKILESSTEDQVARCFLSGLVHTVSCCTQTQPCQTPSGVFAWFGGVIFFQRGPDQTRCICPWMADYGVCPTVPGALRTQLVDYTCCCCC